MDAQALGIIKDALRRGNAVNQLDWIQKSGRTRIGMTTITGYVDRQNAELLREALVRLIPEYEGVEFHTTLTHDNDFHFCQVHFGFWTEIPYASASESSKL